MAKKPKYYAIRVGRKTGIVRTWKECQVEIKGYSGAVYKSFDEEQVALDWLNGNGLSLFAEGKQTGLLEMDQLEEYDVYTDGSYLNGNYSWAYAFIKNDQIVFEGNDIGKNPEAAVMRNVAGEIAAVLYAVQRAAQLNARIRIHHDYAGIAFWVTGEWSAKNEFTQVYVKLMKQHVGLFTFEKVQAHSGNKFNDYVDKLAKEALGII